MSTEPNSYDNVSASNKTLYPSSQILALDRQRDGLAFVQLFLLKHACTVSKKIK